MRTVKLTDVSTKMLAETLDAIRDLREKATKDHLTRYSEKSGEYIRRALMVCIELGLIEQKDTIYVPKCHDSQNSRDAVRCAVGDYPPFVNFCSKLHLGESELAAARKTVVMFHFDNTPEELSRIFVGWGKSNHFLKSEMGKIVLAFDITSPVESPFESRVEERVSAKAFVLNSLGRYAASISRQEASLLTKAIQEYKSDPRGSVDDAGRAIEDQLRSMAKMAGVDVTGETGIVKIVGKMRGNVGTFLNAKHWEILVCLGHMRNAAAHSKDKKTGEHWDISSEFALSYVLLSLVLLRSALAFINENSKQLL